MQRHNPALKRALQDIIHVVDKNKSMAADHHRALAQVLFIAVAAIALADDPIEVPAVSFAASKLEKGQRAP